MASLTNVIDQLKENNETMYTMADFQLEAAASMEDIKEMFEEMFKRDASDRLKMLEAEREAKAQGAIPPSRPENNSKEESESLFSSIFAANGALMLLKNHLLLGATAIGRCLYGIYWI